MTDIVDEHKEENWEKDPQSAHRCKCRIRVEPLTFYSGPPTWPPGCNESKCMEFGADPY